MFLAVTAEEQGLLGSKYYAEHPVKPLDHTVAAINMDELITWGPTKDVTVIGLGNSELDDYARAAAEAQGRHLRPDAEPEKGYFYRSDHFEFAKQGVPALYTDAGHRHGRGRRGAPAEPSSRRTTRNATTRSTTSSTTRGT